MTMGGAAKNEAFHQRLALLIGTEEPFRWAKRIGIPAGTFDRMWNKYDIPKHDHLCRIARGCNVSLDWLLLGDAEKGAESGDYGVLPLIGLANCGIAQGWFNETAPDSTVLLPSFMTKENSFAVVCRGCSMIPAGIRDGNVCIIDPDSPAESGKPALIRTKSFVKGREVSLATIKVFDSQDDSSVTLSGWLDPDETGYQSLFTEKRLKTCVTMIAPVKNVLDVKVPERAFGDQTALDENALVQSLDALRPLFAHLDSKKFAKTVLSLYGEVKKNGFVSPSTLGKILEIGAETLGKSKKL